MKLLLQPHSTVQVPSKLIMRVNRPVYIKNERDQKVLVEAEESVDGTSPNLFLQILPLKRKQKS